MDSNTAKEAQIAYDFLKQINQALHAFVDTTEHNEQLRAHLVEAGVGISKVIVKLCSEFEVVR